MAGKRKLNYRIHDPNPAEVTAEYIAKVLVEVNRQKIEFRPPGGNTSRRPHAKQPG